jgi:hypothetical protein
MIFEKKTQEQFNESVEPPKNPQFLNSARHIGPKSVAT